MGLTTPLALLGLVLIGVPIVAHLLRRSDVRTLRLPTIALLSRAAVESRRRPRLVDPVLLALRVLAVALAVIALATPFTERELAFGDGRVASVVLVIDDSMSMGRAAGTRSLDDLSLERAIEVVSALPEGSEVGVVGAGSPARVVHPRTIDLAAVLEALRRGEPASASARGDDLPLALALAQRQLAGARHGERRIVVLGDFRGRDPRGALELPPGVRVTFERVGDGEALHNVAITAASVEPRAEGATVTFSVRSFGAGAPARVSVRLIRGATELARAEVAIEGGTGIGTLEIGSLSLDADPGATLSIEPGPGDAFAADDTRGVLLRPPSAPRVVLVDRVAHGTSPSRFAERALTLAPRAAGGPLSVRHIDAHSLGTLAVGSVDVLMVLDVDLRHARFAEAVRAHVEDGTGLLVATGGHAVPGSESRIADLLPARIAAEAGPVVGLARPPGTFLPPSAAPDDALSLVRVTRRSVLEPESGAEIALTFADGAPALVVNEAERVAVLGLSLDESFSDLPYRPLFLPLVVRLAVGLSRPGTMPDEPFQAGELGELRAPSSARTVSIVTPSGTVLEEPLAAGALSLDALSEAGAYAVTFLDEGGDRQAAPRSAFVLAPPASESDPTAYDVPGPSEGESEAREGPALMRTNLGPWFFLLVGLACIAEGALRLRKSDA